MTKPSKIKRERLLWALVSDVRNNIDIKNIKKTAVRGITKFLDLDRSFIREYDENQKILPVDEYSEYLSSADEKSMVGIDLEADYDYEYWTKMFIDLYINKHQDVIFIEDSKKYFEENNLQGSKIEEYCIDFNFKSGAAFTIFDENNKIKLIFTINFKTERLLSKEDIDFIKIYVEQVYIAIKQSNILQQSLKKTEREALLRKIIEKYRITLDLNQIKQNIVTEVGKLLNASRVFIIEYDKEKNIFLTTDEYSEYRRTPDIQSTIGQDFNEYDYHINQLKKQNEIIEYDTDKFLEEHNILGTATAKDSQIRSIKSAVLMPIVYANKLLGAIVLHFDKKNAFNPQDLDFIRALANDAGIALYQAKLFEKEKMLSSNLKKTIEREKTLRTLVTNTRTLLDIREIKKTIVKIIGESLGADRCFIIDYDQEHQLFYPVESDFQYLASPDVKSVVGVESKYQGYTYFAQVKVVKEEVFFSDLEEYLKANNLIGSFLDNYHHDYGVQSNIGVPITYGNKIFGRLVIHFTNKKAHFSEEDIEFTRTLATQAGNILQQAKLFQIQKETADRESFLRQIILSSITELDFENVINKIVTETGKLFKADRCFFIHYDKQNNKFIFPIESHQEYNISSDIKKITGRIFTKEETDIFKKLVIEQRQIVVVEDTLKAYFSKESKRMMLDEYEIKSYLAAPIFYKDIAIGILSLNYVSKSKQFTYDEINLFTAVANQSAIVIYQAKLYEREKQTAEREKLIASIIVKSISTFEIDQIKQIVKDVGIMTKADRCYFVEADLEKMTGKPIEASSEYLSSCEIKSIVGYEFPNADVEQFVELYLKTKDLYVFDYEKVRAENKEEYKGVINYSNLFKLKSGIGIPFYYAEKLIAVIAIEYVNNKVLPSEKDLNFLRIIGNQIGIAYNQSQLYQNTKQAAEREALLRKITESIRSNLDINTTLMTICDELLKLIKCDKVTLTKFPNPENYGEMITAYDAKAENDVIGLSEIELDKRTPEYWGNYILGENKNLIINDIEESNTPDYFKKSTQLLRVKSIIGLPIKSGEDKWGTLAIIHANNYKKWTKGEVEFLEIITDQIYLAIKQAELYEFQKKVAKKESILRDLVSEIKLTRDLSQAYNKLLQKLAEIFSLNRVLFLESSKANPDELQIKYEYIADTSDLSVNNLVFPQICIDEFLNLTRNLKTLVINDVSECYPDDTSVFFEKYKIKALLSVPLVKFNCEIKVLGFIVLCVEDVKVWSDEELELINAISNSVVSVIWEISRFIEIEDLRNAFVLTLAHDFQVPLVGEKVALEYLLKYTGDKLGSSKEIVQEILENNKNITTLLNKSVDIYNYESGKKKLFFQIKNIKDIVDTSIRKTEEQASKKSVKVIIEVSQQDLFVEVDPQEILKVFYIIIENAIDNSLNDESVNIKYYKKGSRIIISVQNKGHGMSVEVQQKIFRRYEMAIAIERKIGAGTGLFLSKRIIEAHNGTIWFETEPEKGTIFYISLPIYKQN